MSDGVSHTEQPSARQSLSIVVPIYNEEEVLSEFYARLSAVLAKLSIDAEIVFVNDGSTDASVPIIIELRRRDSRIALLDLSCNFGKEAAVTAGLKHTVGDAVILIDADLQDPPELIPELVRHWLEEDYDEVYAQRISRKGELWPKRVTAAAFYWLMQHVGRVRLPPNTGDFRLLSRRAVDSLNRLPERSRFHERPLCMDRVPADGCPVSSCRTACRQNKVELFRSVESFHRRHHGLHDNTSQVGYLCWICDCYDCDRLWCLHCLQNSRIRRGRCRISLSNSSDAISWRHPADHDWRVRGILGAHL